MHLTLKTLLNHIEPWKGFVYDTSDLTDHGKRAILEIQLRARAGSQGLCGQCQQRAPGYDRQAPRRFQFVPLWGIPTFFIYAPRRLDCHTCGVHVEHLPWALGKRPITKSFAWFLASWAKRLSWQEASRAFKTSWESVYRSVEMAVDWGRSRMDLTGITACGVDEIHWQKGKFLTLVYQINEGVKRLLYIAEERKESSLREFFVRVPAHAGHLSDLMPDSIPGPWRTAVRWDGGQFSPCPEHCPPCVRNAPAVRPR
ncbi:MAG: transposase [Acidiferrobacterales bacterium]